MADTVAVARAYYRALDEADYESLAALLAADFVHDRPDMTLDGRERFVRFMREERPQTDTSHPIDGIYRAADDADVHDADVHDADAHDAADADQVLVRGRLLAADGSEITGFVDVLAVDGGEIRRITTYTD